MDWALNAPSWFIENTVVALLKKLPSWLAVTTFAAIGIDIKDETIANATGIIMLAVAAKPELSLQILSQAIGLMMDGVIGIAEAVSFMFTVPMNAVGRGVSRYQKYRQGLRVQGVKVTAAEERKNRKRKIKQLPAIDAIGTVQQLEQPCSTAAVLEMKQRTAAPLIESDKNRKLRMRKKNNNNNTGTRNQKRKKTTTT